VIFCLREYVFQKKKVIYQPGERAERKEKRLKPSFRYSFHLLFAQQRKL
jgi:hypothetical protein